MRWKGNSIDLRHSKSLLPFVLTCIVLSGCNSAPPELTWAAYVDKGRTELMRNNFKSAQTMIDFAVKQIPQCAAKEQKRLETLKLQAQLLRKQQAWVKCEPVCRRWYALANQVYGESNAETEEARSMLAEMMVKVGRHHEAQRLLTQSIAILEAKYGKKNIFLASPLRDLGWTFHAIGQTNRSLPFYRKALEIGRQCLDPTDEAMIETLKETAVTVYQQEGSADEAEKYFVEALAACRVVNSPQIVSVLHELATLYALSGRQAESRQLLEEARKLASHIGITAELRAAIDVSLADEYLALNKLKEAERLLRNAIIIEKRAGMPLKTTARAYYKLARCMMQSGHFRTAIKTLKLASRTEKLLPEFNDRTLLFMIEDSLAQCFCKLNNRQAELEATQEAYRQITSRERDKVVAFRAYSHDAFYELICHYSEAHQQFRVGETLLLSFLKEQERTYGKTSLEAGRAKYFLAKYYQRCSAGSAKLNSEAVRYFEQALETMNAMKVQSMERSETVRRLALCNHALGHLSEAEKYYRQTIAEGKVTSVRIEEAKKNLAQVLAYQKRAGKKDAEYR